MGALGTVIAFLTSRVGIYLLIAVVGGGFLIGVRQSGYNSAKRACIAAEEKRKKEIEQKDVQIGELSKKQDQAELRLNEKAKEKDDEWQLKLEKALDAERAKRPAVKGTPPARGCVLDDSGLRWLR